MRAETAAPMHERAAAKERCARCAGAFRPTFPVYRLTVNGVERAFHRTCLSQWVAAMDRCEAPS